MTCPITGKLVRNNRLVDDTPRTLDENRAIIDDKLGLALVYKQKLIIILDRRLYGYKYRDDFNRDLVNYELKWSQRDISRAVDEGHQVEKRNKEQFNKRLDKIKKFKLSE